jgi:tungstate transport system substrate-binding protein
MGKTLRILFLGALILTVLGGVIACASTEAVAPLSAKDRFRRATTTSLYDTGLWGYLEPKFEEKYDVEMDIMYAGTGKALEYGQRGDVDAITVHSKSREEQFIADGYGIERYPFAYNYFLVVGPESDPAGIKGMRPEDGFNQLMASGQAGPGEVKFVSRGDNSGTHGKEKAIWQGAGHAYEDVQQSGGWYIEAGAGMGPTLVMAKEKSAYTLTDIGTFLAFKQDLGLASLIEEGDILLNVYSAIAISPDSAPKTKLDMANNLIEFLTSDEIQDLIGKYGVEEYGQELFFPCDDTTVCAR